MSGKNELQRWEINGNDSAQPVINEFSIESWGLTKREYFASIAPNKPEWFDKLYPLEIKTDSSFSKEDIDFAQRYSNDDYSMNKKDFERGSSVSSQLDDSFNKASLQKEEEQFFKWMTFYADKLLKELDK